MGRPVGSGLRTPELEAVIVRAVRIGNKKSEAAKIAGIAPRTLRDWMQKDPEFSATVAQAEARIGGRAWMAISRALKSKDAALAAKTGQWVLERKNLAGPDEDTLRAELTERLRDAREIWAQMRGSVPEHPDPDSTEPPGSE